MADNFEVIKGILGRFAGAERQPCRPQALPGGDTTLQNRLSGHHPVRWFIHPLGYAEAARLPHPRRNAAKGKASSRVMRHQGVAAVLGIGGFVDFFWKATSWFTARPSVPRRLMRTP